jgi:predicted Zn-dependent peptidase
LKLFENSFPGLKFTNFTLNNGLEVYLNKNCANPIVNITVGYKIGSKDEPEGKKGIAHLFEHLMFQGSENVKKMEHFGIVQECGGMANAYTMQDFTAYYDIVPSSHIETALWLESDRMISIDLSEENLENQKSVVIEEKKQRYDNEPYGTAIIKILENIFFNSGYSVSTIGIEEDIRSFKTQEAIEFHKTYYSPSNAVLIISGDIDYSKTEKIVEKYFGGIEKPAKIERKINRIEKYNKNEKITVNDNVSLKNIYLCWQTGLPGSSSEFAFDCFAEIFAGRKSSRLNIKYVRDEKIFKSISSALYQLQDSSVFITSGMLNPEIDENYAKSRLINEINSVLKEGISEQEFEKAKNLCFVSMLNKLSSIRSISFDSLYDYMYFGNPSEILKKLERLSNFRKEELVDSLKEYLRDDNYFELNYLPKSD